MRTPDSTTAAAILPLVGGPANVLTVAHCMTRLRLGLRDRGLVDEEGLRALPAVLGLVADGGSCQIVLGPGTVARVAPAFEALLTTAGPALPDPPAPGGATTPAPLAPPGSGPGTPQGAGPAATAAPSGPPPASSTAPPARHGTAPAATADRSGPTGAGPGDTAGLLAARGAELKAARARRNATPLKLFLRRIADVFVPLIPALIGCGVIAGLNGLLINLGVLPGLTPALTAVAGGFMALIAVFVGHNTAKVFGGTPVLGGAVAAVVVYAGVAKVTVLGVTLAPGQGGVLGALAAALLGTYVEKWCRSWVPPALDVLVTPTLTVLLTGLVTLYALMYAAGELSAAIGGAAAWLLSTTGAFAGLVLGALFLPLVMLGLHQALIPIHATLIEQQGYTVLLPVLAMAGAGQVGAALAVYVRLRHDTSLRTTIRSALPAGLLGVGEPLIYGVSLPLGRPFVTACAGGAAGGAFIGFFSMLGDRVGSTAIGPSGLALFPLLSGNRGLAVTAAIYAGGLLTGYAVGFAATWFLGLGGVSAHGPDGGLGRAADGAPPARPAERNAA
ncbi:PTS transporter subunit EIIC [Streptomyces triticiradicis]|uniref:PTS alpha-glucoside transporter subunit IIA n=1 Tax=Streptomyces triticiradicis TaxID=2651189 RepID=A0A7J5DIP5_9ACTN|nr:PTS transporter subunit EIIC [Streptomyces triticiradicis]KAB1988522.1 PTS alpha-glucoside transporter subunit IIA [Streptomyces triticiradicis]